MQMRSFLFSIGVYRWLVKFPENSRLHALLAAVEGWRVAGCYGYGRVSFGGVAACGFFFGDFGGLREDFFRRFGFVFVCNGFVWEFGTLRFETLELLYRQAVLAVGLLFLPEE